MTSGTARIATHPCRICGETDLFPVIDLGITPIANALVRSDDTRVEQRYPLELVGCPRCALVQLQQDIDFRVIFDEHYPYLSSLSREVLLHSQRHAEELVARRHLTNDSLIIEVASNDGYLLKNFVERGISVLGIEPSPLPASAALAAHVPTEQLSLDVAAAERIVSVHGTADVVIANNVLAHVPDINGFFHALTVLLSNDGILQIENPELLHLVQEHLFDTIYHEHYSYLSSTAERVKGNETAVYSDSMSACRLGSLIQAASGSLGGVGGR